MLSVGLKIYPTDRVLFVVQRGVLLSSVSAILAVGVAMIAIAGIRFFTSQLREGAF